MVDENFVEPEAETATTQEAEQGDAVSPELSEAEVARLIVKRNGAESDSVFEVHPPATIGRFDATVGPVDVDLTALPEAVYVSRKHAAIRCEDGRWSLHDLGSSNGTFLLRDDFERVEEAELSDGAEFALGNARFIFKLGPIPVADPSDG